MTNLISFDWAMKRLLRDKANHAVLEGLMTSLLNEKFTIVRFLESESNQEDENDKFNRVDILAENEKGELTIFEIQNNRELAYFHRILYGVSKVITDYINIGEDYEKVRKVYSINIVYFTLGQAKDYVYHGKTVFQGLHDPHDILKLSNRQSEVFFGDTFKNGEKSQREASDIFPEYYLLCVNNFDKVAKTHLDEWIRFLKTGEIEDSDTAPGLADTKECLDVRKLSREEYLVYRHHKENEAYQRSVISTGYDDGMQDGIKKGRAEGRAEGDADRALADAKRFLDLGFSPEQVAKGTQLSLDTILSLVGKA